MHINKFLEKIEKTTRFTPKRNNNGYIAKCPAHDDKNPSLSISESRDKKLLLKCFTGCSVENICRACNINVSDLFSELPKKYNALNTNIKMPIKPYFFGKSDMNQDSIDKAKDFIGKEKTKTEI